MKFKRGDSVETVDGMVGEVTFTDSARGKVVVQATEDGVGHRRGTERSYKEKEVKKA